MTRSVVRSASSPHGAGNTSDGRLRPARELRPNRRVNPPAGARVTRSVRTTSMIWTIFARLPSKGKKSEDYALECYQAGVIAVG